MGRQPNKDIIGRLAYETQILLRMDYLVIFVVFGIKICQKIYIQYFHVLSLDNNSDWTNCVF